ncbi:unnamed protein product [marine sediment metagenome]|uniref:Uncharacterized protein n=1 Tax=marine sediment metagenome TaxID=412755 RepID=X1BPI6_9ZZZZ
MKIPIFMIFQFFGVISSWASKALQDGKVTALEGFELLVSLAMVLGIPLDFEVKEYKFHRRLILIVSNTLESHKHKNGQDDKKYRKETR